MPPSSQLTDLLDKYRVDYKREGQDKHIRRGWLGFHCPMCGGSSYHYGIQISSGRSNCWKCSLHDTVLALSLLCRIPVSEVLAQWQRGTGLEPRKQAHSGTLRLPAAGPLGDPHKRYLEGRGFNVDELVRLWGIQGIGLAAELKWRILIPIHDIDGNVVSWTTRSIAPDHPLRYISASPENESVPHKSILYGAHLARHCIAIQEGPIDAWAVGPGATATMGLGYSQEQLAVMVQFPVRVVCSDAEYEAQKRADKLCRQLAVFPGITENVVWETGKDAPECDPAEIAEFREKYLG